MNLQTWNDERAISSSAAFIPIFRDLLPSWSGNMEEETVQIEVGGWLGERVMSRLAMRESGPSGFDNN